MFFLPPPTASLMAPVTSIRSINGYPMDTSFCAVVRVESWVYGAIRKTHDNTPTPMPTISESMAPSRSRPGLRCRINNKIPRKRQG